MPFESSSRRLSKACKELNNPDVVIHKPQNLYETCPVTTTTEPLSLSNETLLKKKKPKKQESRSKSVEFDLDSGASLPKTKADVRSERMGAGEPSKSFHSFHVSQNFSCSEIVLEELESNPSVHSAEPVLERSENVGLSKCQFAFKVPSLELNCKDFEEKEEVLEESHALKRWESYLRRQKRQQEHFGKHLGRKPCELLLNQSENLRKVLEEKTLFLYAQIPKADKHRGHPSSWNIEEGLRKINYDSTECPDTPPAYFPVRSKLSQGIVPEMEFVGVPTVIQKEKGVFCKNETNTRNSYYSLWDKSKYRKDRYEKFSKQMRKIKPCDIQMEELAVVGVKIQEERKQEDETSCVMPVVPEIIVSSYEESSDYKLGNFEYYKGDHSVLCLVINGDEIKRDFTAGLGPPPHDSNIHTWKIDFGSNQINTVIEKTLNIENRGTMAVSYEWTPKTSTHFSRLPLIPKHSSWFFFDKNPGIFLPGQIYDLKFYYHSKTPGVQIESWYLYTDPPLFEKPCFGEVLLSAVSTNDYFGLESPKLQAYIDRRVAKTIATYIIKLLLYSVTEPTYGLRGVEYRSFLLEKDLFEWQNRQHYYHSGVVKELKDILQELQLDDRYEWDLSIKSLVTLTKTRTTGKTQDELLCKIRNSVRKLLKPAYVFQKNSKKHDMTYQILCKMVNYMEEDREVVTKCFSRRKDGQSSECYDNEEYFNSSSFKSEESEGTESTYAESVSEMGPLNVMYHQALFFLKVYQRLCEAADSIAGALTTASLLEPTKRL